MFHIPPKCLSPLLERKIVDKLVGRIPRPHRTPLSPPVSQSHADSAAISCRRRAFRRDFKLDCCAVAGSIYVIRWHWLDLPVQLESDKQFWTIPPSRRNFADQLPVCSLLLLRSKLAKMTKMTSLDRPPAPLFALLRSFFRPCPFSGVSGGGLVPN